MIRISRADLGDAIGVVLGFEVTRPSGREIIASCTQVNRLVAEIRPRYENASLRALTASRLVDLGHPVAASLGGLTRQKLHSSMQKSLQATGTTPLLLSPLLVAHVNSFAIRKQST